MSRKINRRSFVKSGAALGVTSILSKSFLPRLTYSQSPVDITVAIGDDYEKNTMEAIRQFGGIESIVSPESRVAILANPQRNNPGSFTSPDVLRAVLKSCKQAGTQEIACISWLAEKNWENTGLKKVLEQENVPLKITNLKDESLFKSIPVPRGKIIKEARIMNTFFDYDRFINVPITKDHAGNKFTGTLKNLMGLNSPASNRTFHQKDWSTNPDSIAYLDQCIADLNTIIQPDLCVVDATELIITNGPFGPGEIYKPKRVVVGKDRVAIDAYCCTLWGLKPTEILMIQNAYDHGLGKIDLSNINIKEFEV